MNRGDKLKEGLINFLTICGDLMALEGLWLICSLPIITIGPSTCALFDITLRIVEDKPFTLFRGFFEAFKKNFKQGLIVGVFCLFVLVTLYADVMYVLAIEGPLQMMFGTITIMVLGMLLIIVTYGNGLIVRYNNTLKDHIINAFKLAFINPLQTLLMWLIILTPLLLFLFVPPIILIYVGWFFLLFVVSLPVYLCSKVLIKIFLKYDSKGKRVYEKR